MSDLISRQAAIERVLAGKLSDDSLVECVEECNSMLEWAADVLKNMPSAQPEHLTDEDFETIRIHLNAYKEQLCNQHRWEEAEDYQRIIDRFKAFASAEPEIIHCKDCIYYDPEHVEKNGVRYEYSDMPKDAFDTLGTGLVTSKYGVNVGGRCCRDYNVGYPEDKRVFVSEQNYCGRGERKS